jgi:hypothetical protein
VLFLCSNIPAGGRYASLWNTQNQNRDTGLLPPTTAPTTTGPPAAAINVTPSPPPESPAKAATTAPSRPESPPPEEQSPRGPRADGTAAAQSQSDGSSQIAAADRASGNNLIEFQPKKPGDQENSTDA